MLHYIRKIPNKNPVIIHSDLLLFGKKILNKKIELKRILIKHFKKGFFIPAFNFGKKKTIRFDKFDHSMGSLTKIFINEKNTKRSLNPVHSYIYKNIKFDSNKYKNNSFGEKSIFNYFYQKKMLWINLGASNDSSFTIFHHAEDICNVSYRKRISFKRKIINKKKIQIKYFYFARKKKLIYDNNKVVRIMIKNKILKEIILKNNYIITYGNFVNILDFLVNKIKKNEKFLLKVN